MVLKRSDGHESTRERGRVAGTVTPASRVGAVNALRQGPLDQAPVHSGWHMFFRAGDVR